MINLNLNENSLTKYQSLTTNIINNVGINRFELPFARYEKCPRRLHFLKVFFIKYIQFRICYIYTYPTVIIIYKS